MNQPFDLYTHIDTDIDRVTILRKFYQEFMDLLEKRNSKNIVFSEKIKRGCLFNVSWRAWCGQDGGVSTCF